MSEPLTDAERQARFRARKQRKGFTLLNTTWVPDPLYAELEREANEEGIPIRDLIIKKLYAGTNG